MTANDRRVPARALAGSPDPRRIDHAPVQRAARRRSRSSDQLERELEPKGVGVVLEAEHLCMSLRGVQKLGAKTLTSALRGLVRDDARTRQEFLALTTRTPHEQ